MSDFLTRSDAVLREASYTRDQQFFWGVVKSVDNEKQKMDVQLAGSEVTVTVEINNNFTAFGNGVRVMPVPDITHVVVARGTTGICRHVGYYLEGVEEL